MQTLDNAIALRPKLKRSGDVRLQTEQDPEQTEPDLHPGRQRGGRVAGRAHRRHRPELELTEALINVPTTAHILGGAVIGHSPEDGVVDSRQRVFGYENLLVCDGAAVPANVGVNPSLTITALAEHAMSEIPPRARRAAAPPAGGAAGPAQLATPRTLGDVVPVDDVPEGVEVVGTFVLVLQVVGVLPDVGAEQRRLSRRRSACPGSGSRRPRGAGGVLDQPGPAGAEAGDAGAFELLLEGVEGAEGAGRSPRRARRSARRRRRGSASSRRASGCSGRRRCCGPGPACRRAGSRGSSRTSSTVRSAHSVPSSAAFALST